MAWTVTGNIQGPAGPAGTPGATGATGPVGPVGPAGATGAQGPAGSQGIQGTAGVNLDIQGSVATYANLPGSPADGDAYIVLADGKLYFYDGTSWPADGAGVPFVGPQGPAGSQGIQGIQGIQGNAGATGAAGTKGTDGKRGSKWFSGAGTPSGVGGSLAGDFYLDTSTGDVYELS